ncbi:MAG: hypothetical protein ABUT39_14510 [Acidobacteriota bacterium]
MITPAVLRFIGIAAAGAILAAAAATNPFQIEIESPRKGETVEVETIVSGRISDPTQQVYVLVRSLRDKEWWVQRVPPPVNQDGSWETLAYFGTATKGAGESFQVIAITSPRRLKERQRFRDLPEATLRSDSVTVRRAS